MPNLAALRAAVFKLFAKKQVGGIICPPPVRMLKGFEHGLMEFPLPHLSGEFIGLRNKPPPEVEAKT